MPRSRSVCAQQSAAAIASRASSSVKRVLSTNTCSHPSRTDFRLGGQDSNPCLSSQSAPCYQLHHPPSGPTSIGVATLRDVPSRPTVLVMAAGHGTRMRSQTPKVLHPVCGRPMLHWTIAAAQDAGAEAVVIVFRPGEGVEDGLPDGVVAAPQTIGEGTGAAVLAARDHVGAGQTVVILSADHPLVSAETIDQLVTTHSERKASATLLTTDLLDPTAYGRIVRDADGNVE